MTPAYPHRRRRNRWARRLFYPGERVGSRRLPRDREGDRPHEGSQDFFARRCSAARCWPRPPPPPPRRLRTGSTSPAASRPRRSRRTCARSAGPRQATSAPSSAATSADVFYKVCVRFPGGRSPLRPAPGGRPGRALRQPDHVEHTRPPQGDLVRQGPAGRRSGSSALTVTARGRPRSASTPRPRTPPSAPARRRSAVRGVDRGPRPDPRPLHATALLPAVERAADAAGGWSAVGAIAVGVGPGSFTGRPHRDRDGEGAGRVAWACPSVASARSTRSRHGALETAGPGRPWRCWTRAAARSSPPSTSPAAPARGIRSWSCPPSLQAACAELPARPLGPDRGRYDFAMSSPVRRRDPRAGRPRPPGRRAGRSAGSPRRREQDRREPIYLRAPDADRWRERESLTPLS